MAGAFKLLGKKRKLILMGHALWTRLRREGSEGSKGSEGSEGGGGGSAANKKRGAAPPRVV